MYINQSQQQYLIPLQLFASQYGYAALLDDQDNEEPITEAMIHAACEEAVDALYWFIPERTLCSGMNCC